MFASAAFSQASFSLDSFLFDLERRIDQQTIEYLGGAPKKKRKEYGPPTEEQIEAERIRLGIIEAKQERKAVIERARKATKGTEQARELKTYSHLLKEQIARLQAEYALLKAKLQAQGEQIRTAAITQAAMLWIETELKRAQQEEEDIAFVLSVLLEL